MEAKLVQRAVVEWCILKYTAIFDHQSSVAVRHRTSVCIDLEKAAIPVASLGHL